MSTEFPAVMSDEFFGDQETEKTVAETLPEVSVSLEMQPTELTMTALSVATLELVSSPFMSRIPNMWWYAKDPEIVDVQPDGTIQAMKYGETDVIAVWPEDKSIKATCHVKVVTKAEYENTPATGISVDPGTVTISVGSDTTIVATLTPSDATSKVTWTTSNEAIATVSGGIVTGVGLGEAVISATANGLETSSVVTVEEAPELTISLERSEMSVGSLDQEVTLDMSGETGFEYVLSSDNTDVAIITDEGKAQAVGAGTANITATASGVTDSVELTVVTPTFYISPVITSPVAGSTGTYTADLYYLPEALKVSENSYYDSDVNSISWSSSNSGISISSSCQGTSEFKYTTSKNADPFTIECTWNGHEFTEDGNPLTLTPTIPDITGFTLSASEVELTVNGDSEIVTVTSSPTSSYWNTKSLSVVSSDEAIATVTNAYKSSVSRKLTITPVGAGTCTITVTSPDESAVSTVINVTVTEESLSSITITPEHTTTYVGESMNVNVVASSGDSSGYTLTSSDSSILQVNADNTVTALSTSDTPVTLTATFGNSSVTSEEISVVALDYELWGTYVTSYNTIKFSYTKHVSVVFGIRPNIISERPDLEIDVSELELAGDLVWTLSPSSRVTKSADYSQYLYVFNFNVLEDEDFSDISVSFVLNLNGVEYSDSKTWSCEPVLVTGISADDVAVALGGTVSVPFTFSGSDSPYNIALSCESGDPETATVDSTTTGFNASVTGVAVGTTTVTLTSTDGTNISEIFNVTVGESELG